MCPHIILSKYCNQIFKKKEIDTNWVFKQSRLLCSGMQLNTWSLGPTVQNPITWYNYLSRILFPIIRQCHQRTKRQLQCYTGPLWPSHEPTIIVELRWNLAVQLNHTVHDNQSLSLCAPLQSVTLKVLTKKDGWYFEAKSHASQFIHPMIQ